MKKHYKGLIPYEYSYYYENGERVIYGKMSMANWTGHMEPEEACVQEDVTWIENKPFKAQLTLKGYEKGRSAVNFVLTDSLGHTYYITLKEMFDLMPTLDKGVIGNEDWIYAKKGTNYSIIPYKNIHETVDNLQ